MKKKGSWKGWAHALGTIGYSSNWTKASIIAFFEDLKLSIPHLDAAMLIAFSNVAGFDKLKERYPEIGKVLDPKLTPSEKEDAIDVLVSRIRGDAESNGQDLETEEKIEEGDDNTLSNAEVSDEKEEVNDAVLPNHCLTEEGLRAFDNSYFERHDVKYAELAQVAIDQQVQRLWNDKINDVDGRLLEDYLRTNKWGAISGRIVSQFCEEVDAIDAFEIPFESCYTFSPKGAKAEPSLMQKLVAYRVATKKRYLNFSSVGSGKTLSGILATRMVDAKFTLVITFNSTKGTCPNKENPKGSGWLGAIMSSYNDTHAFCYRDGMDILRNLKEGKANYIIFNYEKFQQADSINIIHDILEQVHVDFIIFDEVHSVKHRHKSRPWEEDSESQRRKVLRGLTQTLAAREEGVYALGMTATPVVNEIRENVSLLEMVIGKDFSDVNVKPTVNNAVKMYMQNILNAVRINLHKVLPEDDAEVRIEREFDASHQLYHDLLSVSTSNMSEVEQVMLPYKLEMARPYIRKGSIIYTQYVTNIIEPTRKWIQEQLGLTVGVFHGNEKDDLEAFLKEYDVLLGSAAIGTGVDRLQYKSNQIIYLSLPWTGAEFEQINGRVNRQGTDFDSVQYVIPLITVRFYNEKKKRDEAFSIDQRRYNAIKFKRALSQACLDGTIPDKLMPDEDELQDKALKGLRSIIDSLKSDDAQLVDRKDLKIPLDPRVEEVVRKGLANRFSHSDLGSFSGMNRKWSVTHSRRTHSELHEDPSQWYLYHSLYRRRREEWRKSGFTPPYEIFIEELNKRPEWIVADLGCGENLIQKAVKNRVYAFDHIAVDNDVIECDIADLRAHLDDEKVDAVVLSLALMGHNWQDYLREAYRVLRSHGVLFLAEPQSKWEGRLPELRQCLSDIGFGIVVDKNYDGNEEDKFVYIKAIRG